MHRGPGQGTEPACRSDTRMVWATFSRTRQARGETRQLHSARPKPWHTRLVFPKVPLRNGHTPKTGTDHLRRSPENLRSRYSSTPPLMASKNLRHGSSNEKT